MHGKTKTLHSIFFVICVITPLSALCERYLSSDTGLAFEESANLRVAASNSFGDFILQVNNTNQYLYYRSGEGESPLPYYSGETLISVALSDDDRIALVLSEGDEGETILRVADASGTILETYQVEDVSTEDLQITSFSKVFFRPDNVLGALAISAGESIFDATYVVIPSLAMPHAQVTSYGFSFSYVGADSDSSMYLNRCLVSGHSVCGVSRLDGTDYLRLPQPGGARGARLSLVCKNGNYIAQPYPYGPNYYYRKKGEGDYAVYKLAPGKRTRFFRKASNQTVTIADMNSFRTLLRVTSRFKRGRLTRPAIGSAKRPNHRGKVRLLSRITFGLSPDCKMVDPLKIFVSGEILTTALCKQNDERVMKVLRLDVLLEQQ